MDEEKLDKHDHMAWLMWHAAALFRSGGKKLPELSIFLSKRNSKGDEKKKPVAGPNEDAILAWLVSAKNNHEEKKAKK